MRQYYIPSLNGLRMASICMVISDHLVFNGFIKRNFLTKLLGLFFFNGLLGVQFFFVISGFLITTLLIRENEKAGTVSLKNFYTRRALRIFPAYYFFLFVLFVLQFSGVLHMPMVNWFADLTYTKQFFQDNIFETAHLWSLSVEEVFYLIWPILYVKFFSKWRPSWLLAMVLIFPVLRFFDFSYPKPDLSNTIISNGDALLTGCVVAVYYEKIAEWIKGHSSLVLLAFPLLVSLVFLYMFAFHLVVPGSHSSGQEMLTRAVLPMFYAFFGSSGLLTDLLIAVIIVYSINTINLWYRLLNHRLINYLGVISYSIYLWQELFVSKVMYQFHISVAEVLILIFTCAGISYYLIERPFLRFKRAFENRPPLIKRAKKPQAVESPSVMPDPISAA